MLAGQSFKKDRNKKKKVLAQLVQYLLRNLSTLNCKIFKTKKAIKKIWDPPVVTPFREAH